MFFFIVSNYYLSANCDFPEDYNNCEFPLNADTDDHNVGCVAPFCNHDCDATATCVDTGLIDYRPDETSVYEDGYFCQCPAGPDEQIIIIFNYSK